MRRSILTMTALFMLSAGAKAQVTIGAATDPHSFSILELVSDGTRGLRLPQMTTSERDLLQLGNLTGDIAAKAQGLEIFNTDTKCVETWNGNKWIESCMDLEVSSPQKFCSGNNPTVADLEAVGVNIQWYDTEAGETALELDDPLPTGTYIYYVSQTFNGTESKRVEVEVIVENCVTMPALNPPCNPVVPPVSFMTYNLGADPTLDTPKKQMKYCATNQFDVHDARVLGGLFQWGRKWDKTSDATSYPVSVSGSYLRYDGYNNYRTRLMSNFTLAADYDQYGQPVTSHIGYHLYNDDNKNNYDWLLKDKNRVDLSGIYYDKGPNEMDDADDLGMNPNRWGNGKIIGHDFTNDPGGYEGAVPYQGKYYQKPVKTVNDPCPEGFRVPTQDELERICNYGCDPTKDNIGSFGTSITGTVPANNLNLTWVRVSCNYNNNKCVTNGGWSYTSYSGYLIYSTDIWTNASDDYKNGVLSLHEEDAPEPLLFLPAAGYRSSHTYGDLHNVGVHGAYWSSMVSEIDAYSLHIEYGSVSGASTGNRAVGFSVRCVKED
jgi:hypothetical protein